VAKPPVISFSLSYLDPDRDLLEHCRLHGNGVQDLGSKVGKLASLLEAAPSEARRIFNEGRAKRTKRAKRIGWVSLVVDEAIMSVVHFARSIACMLVFLKARSLRSLT